MKNLLLLLMAASIAACIGCESSEKTAPAPVLDKPIEEAKDEPLNNGGFDPR